MGGGGGVCVQRGRESIQNLKQSNRSSSVPLFLLHLGFPEGSLSLPGLSNTTGNQELT